MGYLPAPFVGLVPVRETAAVPYGNAPDHGFDGTAIADPGESEPRTAVIDSAESEPRPTALGSTTAAAGTAESEPPPDGSPASEVDSPEPTASLDPEKESDELVELEDRITVLAAHIHAATHQLLVMIAEFDRRGGWRAGEHPSCAHWLAFRTGIDLHTAREKVRAARALEGLPRTSEAMKHGELSFSKVRALTRVATAENEAVLLEYAKAGSAANLERFVRSWKVMPRADEEVLARRRHMSRRLSVFPDDEGMYLVQGRLDPEVGAVLMRAIDAATDALYRGEGRDGEKTKPTLLSSERTPDQRRADAIGLIAELAMEAGFGDGVSSSGSSASSHGPGAPTLSGAAQSPGLPGSKARRLSGTRAARYQVVLHVESETLSHDQEPGRSELEDGTRVPAGTSRRMACDTSVVRITHDREKGILNVGRRTRTIPAAVRRALEARDRGCRFPGCGVRFTDAHHVEHWADGGETRLENLILLCRRHHRAVHEGGFSMGFVRGRRPVFFDPRGHPVAEAGPSIRLTRDAVKELINQHRERGIDPEWFTPKTRFKRDGDIPADMEFAAMEAMD